MGLPPNLEFAIALLKTKDAEIAKLRDLVVNYVGLMALSKATAKQWQKRAENAEAELAAMVKHNAQFDDVPIEAPVPYAGEEEERGGTCTCAIAARDDYLRIELGLHSCPLHGKASR